MDRHRKAATELALVYCSAAFVEHGHKDIRTSMPNCGRREKSPKGQGMEQHRQARRDGGAQRR